MKGIVSAKADMTAADSPVSTRVQCMNTWCCYTMMYLGVP